MRGLLKTMAVSGLLLLAGCSSMQAFTNNNQLSIPANATNVSFMAGKWRCITSLERKSTGEPIEAHFDFSPDGVGIMTIREPNDVCVGNARASLQNHQLEITTEKVSCQKRDYPYSAMRINCQNKGLFGAECSGRHSTGGAWKARFVRL